MKAIALTLFTLALCLAGVGKIYSQSNEGNTVKSSSQVSVNKQIAPDVRPVGTPTNVSVVQPTVKSVVQPAAITKTATENNTQTIVQPKHTARTIQPNEAIYRKPAAKK